MPQRRTAIKELRKTHTRQMHNLDIKSDLKKTLKTFISAAKERKPDAPNLLKTLYKKFDKAANRKILHRKTSARRKSRFAKLLKAVTPSAEVAIPIIQPPASQPHTQG